MPSVPDRCRQTPEAPSTRAFFQAWNLPEVDFNLAASWATVSWPLTASSATLALEAGLYLLRPFDISHSFQTATAGLSLGAGFSLSLAYLSEFRGPPQTTVTLWEARAAVQGDPSVLVTVKLIECPKKLADTIANTTNTQAALKAEDNISNEPVQRRLKLEFGVMSPPWFYQTKRGEWSKMLGGQSDKEKYRDAEEGYRKLTSKEVAQAILAFAGFPGEAKDRIRDFLNKEEISPLAPEASINYSQIYTNALTAKQLLLPAVIQRKVWKQVADDDDDWLEYARFHIMWLIGVVLRQHYGLAHHGLFTAQRAERVINEIDNWFNPMFYTSVQAISVARSYAQSMGGYPGHREYFRTPANYRAIESSLETILKNPKTLADVTVALPS